MADVNKEIALKVTTDVGQTTKQFGSATEELKKTQKALVEMALAGKQGTKEFREMETRAGQLRDTIGDVRQRVNALASDTPKLDLLTGAAQGIAGGFAAAQGAAALFAGENEEVQQAILKTQGAMALLNGVQQVANTLNKNSAVMVQLNAASTRAYSLAVGTSTGALKLFRLALIATGIGAAVVAIGALVANWDKLTGAVMKFVEASPMLTKIVGFITDGFQKLGRAIGIIPSESEKATRQMIADLEKQLKILEAAGAETFAIQKRLAELRLQLAKETNEGIAEAEDALNILMAKKYGEDAKAKEQAKKKQLEDELKAIEKSKAAREKDAAEQIKLLDEIEQEEKRRADAKIDAAQQLAIIQNDLRRSQLTAFEREQEDYLLHRQKMAELMKASGASEMELMVFNQNTQRVLQNNAYNKEIEDAKIAADKKKQIKEDETLFALEMTKKGLQAIADFTAFFAGKGEEAQKRAFELNKKAGIAIALIDTFVSAQQVFRNTPGLIVIKSLAAAAATAAGLARVAAIRRTTYQSASTSAAPQAIRPAGIQQGTPPPQGFNPNTSTPFAPPQGNPQGQSQGSQRVFVLERDITNVGRRVASVERFATFG